MSTAREQHNAEWKDSWQQGFSNLVAHKYFRVDLARRWQILQDILLSLRLALEDLFTDLNHQSGPAARV